MLSKYKFMQPTIHCFVKLLLSQGFHYIVLPVLHTRVYTFITVEIRKPLQTNNFFTMHS